MIVVGTLMSRDAASAGMLYLRFHEDTVDTVSQEAERYKLVG